MNCRVCKRGDGREELIKGDIQNRIDNSETHFYEGVEELTTLETKEYSSLAEWLPAVGWAIQEERITYASHQMLALLAR